MYQGLEIVTEVEPKSINLDWANMTHEQRAEYPRRGYVVNSLSELCEDNVFGLDGIKALNIDFSRYTLLVNYILLPGEVLSHEVLWYRNNIEGTYDFRSCFGLTPFPEEEHLDDFMFTYYRSAIVVDKLPEDAKVVFGFSN